MEEDENASHGSENEDGGASDEPRVAAAIPAHRVAQIIHFGIHAYTNLVQIHKQPYWEVVVALPFLPQQTSLVSNPTQMRTCW